MVLGINAQGPDGRVAAAVDYYRRSLEVLERAGKEAPPVLLFRVKVYLAGVLSRGFYQLPEASALLDDALSSAKDNAKIPNDLLAAAWVHRGLILVDEARFDQADASFHEAIDKDKNAFDAWTGLARSKYLRNDFSAAAEFARRDYELAAAYGEDDRAEAAMEWAHYRSQAGEPAQALAQSYAALPIMRKNYLRGYRLGYWLEAAASVSCKAGRYEEAARLAREALVALREGQVPEMHPYTAASWEDLGDALLGSKQDRDAAPDLEKAVQIYRRLGSAYAPIADRIQSERTTTAAFRKQKRPPLN